MDFRVLRSLSERSWLIRCHCWTLLFALSLQPLAVILVMWAEELGSGLVDPLLCCRLLDTLAVSFYNVNQ